LSEGDKKVLRAISAISQKDNTSNVKVESIREMVEMTSNTFTTYRKRLMESGVVNGSQYGYMSLALPRFDKFISDAFYD
jgi:Mn-dependent DtxR family transcriptional regulator